MEIKRGENREEARRRERIARRYFSIRFAVQTATETRKLDEAKARSEMKTENQRGELKRIKGLLRRRGAEGRGRGTNSAESE